MDWRGLLFLASRRRFTRRRRCRKFVARARDESLHLCRRLGAVAYPMLDPRQIEAQLFIITLCQRIVETQALDEATVP